jgi:hypothetical protein
VLRLQIQEPGISLAIARHLIFESKEGLFDALSLTAIFTFTAYHWKADDWKSAAEEPWF